MHFLVVTVKKWLKSVYIYRSYRKIKTGITFWSTDRRDVDWRRCRNVAISTL